MACTYKLKGVPFSEAEIRDMLREDAFFYKMRSIDPEVYTKYTSQLDYVNATGRQKQAAEKLMMLSEDVEVREDADGKSYYFHKPTNTILDRSTSVMENQSGPKGQKGFYGFDADPTKYENERQWGNIMDDVLSGAIRREPLDQVISDVQGKDYNGAEVSDDVIIKAYDIFTELIEENPESIFLTQVTIANVNKSIAGTMDILMIQPDGTVKIIDLKTSKYKVSELDENGNVKFPTYEKTTESGQTVKNAYHWRFNDSRIGEKASKKDRHEAQQSIYKGLLRNEDIEVDPHDGISILPIELTDIDGSLVKDIDPNPIVKLNPQSKFIDLAFEESAKETKENIVEQLIKFLENRYRKALKEGRKKQANYIKNKLLKDIRSMERLNAVIKFIDHSYDQVLGNEKTGFPGYAKLIESKINSMDTGNPMEQINDLQSLYEHITLYDKTKNPILGELVALMQRFKDEAGITEEEGSPIKKLSEIQEKIDTINREFKEAAIPKMAQILYDEIPAHQKADESGMKSDIRTIERRLNAYKRAQEKSPTKSRAVSIKRLENNLQKMRESIPTKENLENMLRGNFVDVGLVDAYGSPVISSSNAMAATFALKMKNQFEDARLETRNIAFNISKAIKKYAQSNNVSKDNTAKFNEGLFEKTTYFRRSDDGEFEKVERMGFVQPTDTRAFTESFLAMNEKFNELLNRAVKPDGTYDQQLKKLAYDFRREWYDQNTESKEAEDYVVNGVVIEKGYKSIIADMKKQVDEGIITKAEYDQWYASNTVELENGKVKFVRELSRPSRSKYSNKAWEKLLNDKNKLEYYTTLLGVYFEHQEMVPSYRNGTTKFVLPSIVKSGYDKLKENGIKEYGSLILSDTFSIRPEDEEEFGELSGNLKSIPVMYESNNMRAEDMSVDLAQSILKYAYQARLYNKRSNLKVMGDIIVDLTKEASPIKVRDGYNKVVDAVAKAANIKGDNLWFRKEGENNVYRMLAGFVDIHIYGRNRVPSGIDTPLGRLDLNKSMDALISFSSKKLLGLNAIQGLVNDLQGNVMTSMEAVAGEHITKKSWLWAQKEFSKYTAYGEFLKDSVQEVEKSKIGQLLDIYDAVQGTFVNEFGHTISKGARKHIRNWSLLFIPQNLGETHVQGVSTLAKLKDTKVYLDGKEISLYDAYELGEDGKIKLKDGVDVSHLGELTSDGLVVRSVMNENHQMNKRLHGVYNQFDQPIILRHWFGRLFFMFRKFAIPGFKKRYKALGYDVEAGTFTEGFMRTFYKAALEKKTKMFAILNPNSEIYDQYTEYERANIKRALVEMGTIMVVAGIMLVLGAMMRGGDDDEKRVAAALMAPLFKLQTELSFYGSPGDFGKGGKLTPAGFIPIIGNVKEIYRSFRSPSAVMSTVDGGFRLVSNLTTWERYKRSGPGYDKGDYKWPVSLQKFVGISPNKWNPEAAIKSLEYQLR